MIRNENTKIRWALLVVALLFTVGCATIANYRPQVTARESRAYRLIPLRDSENTEIVYSYIMIEDESYLDIINREARANRPPQSIWKKKRHIGFFGLLNKFERKIGIKVVVPF